MSTIDKIVDLLSKKRIPQKDLAIHLGLNPVVVAEWKSGKSKSYSKYINEIAQYLDTSVDYLLGNTNNPRILKNESSYDTAAVSRRAQIISDKLSKLGINLDHLSSEDLDRIIKFISDNRELLLDEFKKNFDK